MTPRDPVEQRELFAFLGDPDAHGGQPVKRIDTHASAIFLVADSAIKVKKAVHLPFLDFSRVEDRRRYCEAEVALNRRTAPQLYRGCEPVRRSANGFTIGGRDGEIVDWAILMNRFDAETQFDVLARNGKLSPALAVSLAEEVADFHDALPASEGGGADALRRLISDMHQSFAPFRNTVFDAATVDAVLKTSRDECERLAALADARRAQGFVRHCHGDLHLRNIFLDEGRPVLFDCIEFSEDIAVIDVLYDLAFLLMDLRHEGLVAHASYVLNHYMDLRADYGGLPLMPLFLSLRAQIRAHVTAAAAEANPDPGAMAQEARRYLDEAQAYLRPVPPRLVAVGGLAGSGKSRCARELAPMLGRGAGAVVLRTDVIRKRLQGVKPWDRLPPESYTAEASRATYAAMERLAAEVLRGGDAVIADAVFAGPEERQAVEEVAADQGVAFAGLWLEAAPDVAARRVAERVGDASDATPDVLALQMTYELGEISWTKIDSSGSKDATDRAARRAVFGRDPDATESGTPLSHD